MFDEFLVGVLLEAEGEVIVILLSKEVLHKDPIVDHINVSLIRNKLAERLSALLG